MSEPFIAPCGKGWLVCMPSGVAEYFMFRCQAEAFLKKGCKF